MVVEIHVITNGPVHSTVSNDGQIEARALQTAFEVCSQELYSMVAMKENAGLRVPTAEANAGRVSAAVLCGPRTIQAGAWNDDP